MNNQKLLGEVLLAVILLLIVIPANAYPPAVGIMGKAKNCLVCHTDNGNWLDNNDLIIDIINKNNGQSLRQSDGSFLLQARRNESVTILTVIGYRSSDPQLIPENNAWIYVDPATIGNPESGKTFIGTYGGKLWVKLSDGSVDYNNINEIGRAHV